MVGDGLLGCPDKTARTWDAKSGAPLTVLAGHGDVVYGAAYSPDGARIVTASWDRTARIWDADTGAQRSVQFLTTAVAPAVTWKSYPQNIFIYG